MEDTEFLNNPRIIDICWKIQTLKMDEYEKHLTKQEVDLHILSATG
jgi:hypothetical protein